MEWMFGVVVRVYKSVDAPLLLRRLIIIRRLKLPPPHNKQNVINASGGIHMYAEMCDNSIPRY